MIPQKKYVLDLRVKAVQRVHERYVLIRLTDEKPLPPMLPGQFVEVRVDGSPSTFLRRPISINFVDYEQNELWLLVATVGDGTRRLAQLQAGDRLNCVLPLGNGFSPLTTHHSPLLVGGGVGVAPLLYLGKTLHDRDTEPTFLLGARTAGDLLMLDEFKKYGRVFVTTEDGSMGERGFVTNHTILFGETNGANRANGANGANEANGTNGTGANGAFDLIQCCGPTPMMKAVARYASEKGIECEVSLENLMACGLGACLCCVEKMASPDPSKGGENYTNVCVCKEGPVFNIKRLLWQS